ncbi:hypothetical protein L209DRAFT_88448 [Thermothelomyces heterothallicus CBS 203.75]
MFCLELTTRVPKPCRPPLPPGPSHYPSFSFLFFSFFFFFGPSQRPLLMLSPAVGTAVRDHHRRLLPRKWHGLSNCCATFYCGLLP